MILHLSNICEPRTEVIVCSQRQNEQAHDFSKLFHKRLGQTYCHAISEPNDINNVMPMMCVLKA